MYLEGVPRGVLFRGGGPSIFDFPAALLPSEIMLRAHKYEGGVRNLRVRVMQIQGGSLSVFSAASASLCVHAFWFVYSFDV